MSMLLLGGLALSLLVGVLRGGQVTAIGAHRWRTLALPFLAVGVQIVAFLPDESASVAAQTFAARLHVTSYLLLLTFVWLNRRVPWMWLVGLGLAANAVVIIANGGFMPVALDVLQPRTLEGQAAQDGIVNNIALLGTQTRLGFLADIFRTPEWLGLPRAFSLGDLTLATGAFALVQRLMRPVVRQPEGAP